MRLEVDSNKLNREKLYQMLQRGLLNTSGRNRIELLQFPPQLLFLFWIRAGIGQENYGNHVSFNFENHKIVFGDFYFPVTSRHRRTANFRA